MIETKENGNALELLVPAPLVDTSNPDAGFTVQQTVKLTGLSEHTLRYYERAGLVRPIHRQDSSKHRRYSLSNINMLQILACLRAAGMSLDQMRQYEELLQQGDAAATEQRHLFEDQQQILQKQMELMQWNMNYVALKIAYWRAVEEGNKAKAEEIRQQVDEKTRAYVRR